MTKGDALKRLWDSTAAFHKRFNTPRDLEARVRVLVEEAAELIRAVDPDDVAQEAADVLVTAFGVAMAVGIELDLERVARSYVGSSIRSDLHDMWTKLFTLQFHLFGDRGRPLTEVEGCLIGVCRQATGFTTVDAIKAVITKNDAKTPDTHYLDMRGKVVRREWQ